jgi:threonine aldolase
MSAFASDGSSPVVDLRSDTVTRPDPAMRRAMASAEVGDDVLGEDPTAASLEEVGAALVGMEAALFMPSGTMGNQVALHLLARPGHEVICEATSHIFNYEMAAMAALSGLLPRPVAGTQGLLAPADVERAMSPRVSYRAPTGLVALENSANMAGGTVYAPDEQMQVVEVARRHGVPAHLDGARIFNAAVALGLDASALTRGFDSVMFSLSKGLGAPVGSLLCGSRPLIKEARRVRKMFGGGMRQVGVLAAAGLLAVREGPSRLAADHERAARLGRALEQLPGVRLATGRVVTNIVIVAVEDGGGKAAPAARLARDLRRVGILALPVDPTHLRLVTHRDVDEQAFSSALERIPDLASGPRLA